MKHFVNILLCSALILTITGCGNSKNISSKEEEKSEKEYYCEQGTLNGNNCEILETKEATKTCDEGYNLKDEKCVKTTTVNAKANKSCSDGYTLSGNICVSKNSVDKIIEKKCIESYTQRKDESSGWYYQALRVENGSCIIRICRDGPNEGCYETSAEAEGRAVCPSGTQEINGKCYKTSNVTTTYSCDSGNLNGSQCTITETKDYTNTCKTEGFNYNQENKKCEKITTTKALEK